MGKERKRVGVELIKEQMIAWCFLRWRCKEEVRNLNSSTFQHRASAPLRVKWFPGTTCLLLQRKAWGLRSSSYHFTMRCGEGFEAASNTEKLMLALRTLWRQEGPLYHTHTRHRFVTVQLSGFACFPLFSLSPFFPLNNRWRFESLDFFFFSPCVWS